MDKEIKMKLLEQLMEDMDKQSVKKFQKPNEPESDDESPVVEVTKVEHEELPIEDVKDLVAEKLEVKDEDTEEVTEDQDDEEDYEDSDLMKRLREIKKKKIEE